MFLLAAAEDSWKDKPAAQWSDAEAQQILTDSPWARPVTPLFNPTRQRGMGRRGGMGGGGLGMPGGRRGGMGYPGGGGGYPGGGGGYPGGGGGYPGGGGGYPGGGNTGGRQGGGQGDYQRDPPNLIVRWESALPIQQALLKSKDTAAPTVDQGHYVIVVTGVPERMFRGDPRAFEDKLKKEAQLMHDGKKLMKPSDVKVLSREEGSLIVYLFPRSKEITSKDKEIELDAHIGPLEMKPVFDVAGMSYQGKLEL